MHKQPDQLLYSTFSKIPGRPPLSQLFLALCFRKRKRLGSGEKETEDIALVTLDQYIFIAFLYIRSK